MKPPFTFKQWLEEANILRDHERTLEQSSDGEDIETEDKNLTVEEHFTVEDNGLYTCKRCGSRFISEEDAKAHLEAARENPDACKELKVESEVKAWKWNESGENKSDGYITIKILKMPPVCEFVGIDGKVYEIKEEEQVLTIPEANARPFLENGFAIKVGGGND